MAIRLGRSRSASVLPPGDHLDAILFAEPNPDTRVVPKLVAIFEGQPGYGLSENRSDLGLAIPGSIRVRAGSPPVMQADSGSSENEVSERFMSCSGGWARPS